MATPADIAIHRATMTDGSAIIALLRIADLPIIAALRVITVYLRRLVDIAIVIPAVVMTTIVVSDVAIPLPVTTLVIVSLVVVAALVIALARVLALVVTLILSLILPLIPAIAAVLCRRWRGG